MASGFSSSAPPSPLWLRFVRIDAARAFHPHFAAALSRVDDRRAFADRLARLMRQWRAAHWDRIFLSPPPEKDKDKERDKERERERGKDKGQERERGKDKDKGQERGKDKDKGKERDKDKDREGEAGVDLYYESVRVQRLMDAALFPPGDAAAESPRRGLLRALDEVWRGAGARGADFLLPVTEREAPRYYRLVRHPVSVAAMYCGVWDAEIESFTALKERWALMRLNCERFNGVGSEIARACGELVKMGNAATRDAKGDEACEVESERSLPVLTMGELEKMFPSRMKAGASAGREEGDTNNKERVSFKRVLCLRRQPVDEKKEAPEAGELKRSHALSTSTLPLRIHKESTAPRVTPPTRVLRLKRTKTDETEEGNEKDFSAAAAEEKTDHKVQCTQCGAWRLLPGKAPSNPKSWNCSHINMTCEKQEEEPEKKKQGRKPLPRNEPAKEAKPKKLVSQTRKTKKRTRDELSDRETDSPAASPRARPKRRTAKPPPSLSSSSSSDFSDSSESSDSLSSSSSAEDSDESESSRRKRSRRAHKAEKKRKGKQSAKATAKTKTKTNKSAKNAKVVEPVGPQWTAEELIALEAEMDELEAAPVQQDAHAIFVKLKNLERTLYAKRK